MSDDKNKVSLISEKLDKENKSQLYNLPKDIQNNLLNYELMRQQNNGGFLGGLWGTKPKNIILNGTIFTNIALIISIIISHFFYYDDNSSASIDYIKMVIPVITLSLGYLFGKKD